MTIDGSIDQLLDFGILPTGLGEFLHATGIDVAVCSEPYIVDDLLPLSKFLCTGRSVVCGTSKIFQRLRDHVRRNLPGSHRFFQRAIIANKLVKINTLYRGYLGETFLEVIHRDTGTLKLRLEFSPTALAATHSLLNNAIHRIDWPGHDRFEFLMETTEERLCFLKVSEYKLPCLSPARACGFLQRVHQLRESLHFRRSIGRGLSEVENRFDVLLAITLGAKLSFVIRTADLIQCLIQDVGSQPTAHGQRLTERTILLDQAINVFAHVLSGTLERILKLLTTHTGINDRVPVHKADATGRKRLRKLIHRRVDLCSCRTRHSTQVRYTLDRTDRGIQVYTSGGKGTDVLCHLGEVVDRQVSVLVELVEGFGDVVHRRTLTFGVRKDRLNGVHLELVLFKTRDDRISRERFHKTRTGLHRRSREVRQRRHTDDLQGREPSIDGLDTLLHTGEIDILRGFTDGIKPLYRSGKLELRLELLKRRHRRRDVLLEIFVIESHLDNAFINNFTHSLVTSLQASSAILSKIG